MRTVAFIPVRGGSKSIPGKNIKLLAGRPLLEWTIEAATQAVGVECVYVSSDSQDILEVARKFGDASVVPLERSPQLATDMASTDDTLLDFARKFEFDRVVLIQATSPLTTAADIEGALRSMDEQGLESLLSVTHEHRFRWKRVGDVLVEPENYRPEARPRRQDWDGELVENGAFYITSRGGLLRSSCRLNGKVGFWTMSIHSAFEIDTPDDWEVLATLVASRRIITPGPLPGLRLLVTDVDGVLTDAGMYYGPEGEALKKFNTRDGMGTALWRASGREIAIVTGENSPAVARRAEKLHISEVHLGVKNKLPLVAKLAESRGLELAQVAYIGDDLNDLEVMRLVGFCACPADAHPRIQAVSHLVARTLGGSGCVREIIEWLLSRLDSAGGLDLEVAKGADV